MTETFKGCHPTEHDAIAALSTVLGAPQPVTAEDVLLDKQLGMEGFWPVREGMSRGQLIAQIGEMNLALTSLREQNALLRRNPGYQRGELRRAIAGELVRSSASGRLLQVL